MRKFISLIFPVALMLSCCLLNAEKSYSQTADEVEKTAGTEVKKPVLFNEAVYVRGITTARAIGLAELLLGLLSIVFALRAKKRSSINGAKNSFRVGLLALVFSIAHFLTTAGAVFGSGSGKAGAILAIILSLAGMLLSRSVLRKK